MDTSPGSSSAEIKVKAEVRHLYKNSYLKYGFSSAGPIQQPRPKCLVCDIELDNKDMMSVKLKKHFNKEHTITRDEILEDYFIKLQKQVKSNNVSINEIANDEVESYEKLNCKAIKLIVKNMPSIEIPRAMQYLILPACEKIRSVSHICQIQTNSISGYIKKIPSDIRQQLVRKIGDKKFSLLLDIHHRPFFHLLGYVRFVDEHSIVEHFLCYIELTPEATESDIYHSVEEKLETNGLNFQHCVSIFVASMKINKNKSFVEYLQEKLPNKTIKCWYARDVLITQTIPEDLKNVMKKVEKMIQSIIFSPAGHRITEIMCQVMGRHQPLLFCTKYWMFISQALHKVYDQREELPNNFTKKKQRFTNLIRDKVWWSKFAYFADISQIVIDFIESIQGAESYIFMSLDKLESFVKKIKMWKEEVKNKEFSKFGLTARTDPECISSLILEHLSAMENKLPQYFPFDKPYKYNWIRNPFALKDEERNDLPLRKREMLADLSHNRDLELSYREEKGNLVKFWIIAKEAYPELADDALSILLQFSSSYMLDEGRSALHAVTFYKEELLLSIEDELLLHLSTIPAENQKRIVIDVQSTN